jgi:hypothetical protein
MTLIRLVQRASILTGMTFASLSLHINPAHTADTPEFCIIASNGKTACGKVRSIERVCITTDGNNTVCGKFKLPVQAQGQETKNPEQTSGYRKESDGVVYLLRSCRRSNSDIKCNLAITTRKEHKYLTVGSGKGSSSIVDSAGRTYPSSNLEHNGSNKSSIIESLSPGVDYVVDVNFENIPGQITQASLVNIVPINTAQDKVIQFKNVLFSN